MKELFQELVYELHVTTEGQHSLFVTIAGGYIPGQVGYFQKRYLEFTVGGDCCSESWWADIIGVENLLNSMVTGIRYLELPQPTDDRTRQDVDDAYGYRLETPKGDCDLIFRNSSNGYYGGSLDDAVWHKTLPDGLFKLTTDWKAEDTVCLRKD